MANAIEQFLISSIGGFIVGLIIGVVLVRARVSLTRRGIENVNMFTFIQLLTPFVTYLIAEMFHASGIIAAVVAGLVHGFERDRISQARTRLQMSYNHTWNIIGYALNGFVFAILGYLIPEVVGRIIENEPHNLLFLIIVTVLIALAIYVFRFLWVFVLYPYFYLPVSPFQKMMSDNENNQTNTETPPKRGVYAFIMSLCGVHGTISLAIALTLPYMLANHHSFAFRDDLLFVASGMVIISLVIAQFLLPLFTTSAPKPKDTGMNYKHARIFILEKVIESLNKNSTLESSFHYGTVIKEYHEKLAFLRTVENEDENIKELQRLQKIAFEVENDTLNNLVVNGDITTSVLDNYMRYAERTQIYKQASLMQRLIVEVKVYILKIRIKKRMKTNAASSLSIADNLLEISNVMRTVHYRVVSRLSKETTEDNKLEVGMICDGYLARRDNLTPSNFFNPKNENSITKIRLDALKEQRRILNQLIEEEDVSDTTALKIRESINYDEMVIVDSLT